MRSEGGGVVTGNRDGAERQHRRAPASSRRWASRLVLGRDFTDQDVEQRPLVAILNETAARTYFGAGSPIGRRVSFDGPRGPWREIVGVARDSKYGALSEDPLAVAYLPLAQNHETGMVLYARTSVRARVADSLQSGRRSRSSSRTCRCRISRPSATRSGPPSMLRAWAPGSLASSVAWRFCSRRWASTACCRSRPRAGLTRWASVWRSAPTRATCSCSSLRDGMRLVAIGLAIGVAAGPRGRASSGQLPLRRHDDRSAHVSPHHRAPRHRLSRCVRDPGPPRDAGCADSGIAGGMN